MTVSRYRLTILGYIGALLFVAPTPLAAYYALPAATSVGDAAFNQRLSQMGAAVEAAAPSPTILIALATASLLGLLLLLIGREIVTTEV